MGLSGRALAPVEPPPSGYLHSLYAAALRDIGTPRFLRHSLGWLLEREIPGTPLRDAIGCYPLFCCADWPGLATDLTEIEADLTSVCVVTDPFAPIDKTFLSTVFPDLALPFKEHFVLDLQVPIDSVLDAHHRRNVRKGRSSVQVTHLDTPGSHGNIWTRLYQSLDLKRQVRGLANFSPESLKAQLRIPGVEVFAASNGDEIVGMTVWMRQGGVAYYHLGAYSAAGYASRAAYAMFHVAIGHLARSGIGWVDFGAAPGLTDDADNGLARFKRGWATETRTAFLCGRILQRRRYEQLTEAAGSYDSTYFPAYRLPLT